MDKIDKAKNAVKKLENTFNEGIVDIYHVLDALKMETDKRDKRIQNLEEILAKSHVENEEHKRSTYELRLHIEKLKDALKRCEQTNSQLIEEKENLSTNQNYYLLEEENKRLKEELILYEKATKDAFLRSAKTLNSEALNIFQNASTRRLLKNDQLSASDQSLDSKHSSSSESSSVHEIEDGPMGSNIDEPPLENKVEDGGRIIRDEEDRDKGNQIGDRTLEDDDDRSEDAEDQQISSGDKTPRTQLYSRTFKNGDQKTLDITQSDEERSQNGDQSSQSDDVGDVKRQSYEKDDEQIDKSQRMNGIGEVEDFSDRFKGYLKVRGISEDKISRRVSSARKDDTTYSLDEKSPRIQDIYEMNYRKEFQSDSDPNRSEKTDHSRSNTYKKIVDFRPDPLRRETRRIMRRLQSGKAPSVSDQCHNVKHVHICHCVPEQGKNKTCSYCTAKQTFNFRATPISLDLKHNKTKGQNDDPGTKLKNVAFASISSEKENRMTDMKNLYYPSGSRVVIEKHATL